MALAISFLDFAQELLIQLFPIGNGRLCSLKGLI